MLLKRCLLCGRFLILLSTNNSPTSSVGAGMKWKAKQRHLSVFCRLATAKTLILACIQILSVPASYVILYFFRWNNVLTCDQLEPDSRLRGWWATFNGPVKWSHPISSPPSLFFWCSSTQDRPWSRDQLYRISVLSWPPYSLVLSWSRTWWSQQDWWISKTNAYRTFLSLLFIIWLTHLGINSVIRCRR